MFFVTNPLPPEKEKTGPAQAGRKKQEQQVHFIEAFYYNVPPH